MSKYDNGCGDQMSESDIYDVQNAFCNHADCASSFILKELREHLTKLGIATSQTTPYNPQGNSQCECYNGIVWKHIRLALASRNLPETQWETVLSKVLQSIRYLLCTATNTTPHERPFSYQRQPLSGHSVPSWLAVQGPVLLRHHASTNKYETLVEEVQLVETNLQYAHVHLLMEDNQPFPYVT